MGAQQGGLLATDVFLETDQDRVKISCKSPDMAFVTNSRRNHRPGLGNDTVRWNVACFQISSLSLTLSLGFFLLHILSNPPHPSLSVLVQVGISQPGDQSNSLP